MERNNINKRDFQDILAYVYAGFATVVAFWIYVKTLAPTVSFFDSGELISAAYTLGVAHPPGYPLYVTLGWLFTKLPIGSVAYRLNLMSAFFAALASLMVYGITYLIITESYQKRQDLSSANSSHPDPERMLQPIIGMIAALTFVFSIAHWQHALIAEVYSLNAFLCGLIVLLLVMWRRYQKAEGKRQKADPAIDFAPGIAEQPGEHSHAQCGHEKDEQIQNPLPTPDPSQEGNSKYPSPKVTRNWLLYLIAFLFGLGFGNHQTISLLFFAACFLVVMTIPRILLQPKILLLIVMCAALGLSIYLFVPLRAAQNPPINWGNPVTWKQFKWLVTREGYSKVTRGKALQTLWQDLTGKEPAEHKEVAQERESLQLNQHQGLTRLSHAIRQSLFFKQLKSFDLPEQFGYIGVMLAVLGLLYGIFAHRIVTFTLLIAVLSLVLLVILIGDPPAENIFLVAEFHTPAYLLVAVWIGIGAMAFSRAVLWVAFKRRYLQYTIVVVLAVYFLIPPGVRMIRNVRTVDRRRNYVAYDYASNVFASLQPNAIFFTWGDSGAFPLWYLQIVEQQRPDVTLIHVPHLSADWYVELLPQDLFPHVDSYLRYNGQVVPLLDEIVQHNVSSRPIYFDFSSSHSIALPYRLLPNGVAYKVEIPGDRLDETQWNRYRFRGILDNIRIARDPDVNRTFVMYGAARIELGNYYLDRNETEKAAEQFNLAVQLDPELGEEIVRSLEFRDKLAGEQLRPAPQPKSSPN